MSGETTSVLIAEDQDIMRLGLRLTLEKIAGVTVVGEAADGEEAMNRAKELQPAVILMDIDLPVMDGIAATKEIKRILPKTAIIMFTSDATDESIFAALGAGANGYCLKNVSADRLGIAISSVVQGAAWLDPGVAQRVLSANAERKGNIASKTGENALLEENEVELLQLIEGGKNLEEVAQQLHVESVAVEVKVREILSNFLRGGNSAQDGIEVKQDIPGLLKTGTNLSIRPGTVIGDRYTIEEEIGSGGMSTVYRAKHNVVQRLVAIKMLHRQLLTEEVQVSRFYQEAKTAGILNHANIVTVFDFGLTSQHQPFLVMDYVNGTCLDKEIDKGPIELKRNIKIFTQVCDALAHAHKKGIIHRDLKPSNIMLITDEDTTDFVKLLDFGIAKIANDANGDVRLTRTGDLFGTPLYMSPEQCETKPTDARSDIYSLGCVMYEALTGRVPFVCDSPFQAMSSHVYEEPSRLPFLVPGKAVPAELDAILFQMLAKAPDARPQSISEVRAALVQAEKHLNQG
jgi:DNA-binding NarL/FixJ family response regulator/tRNA A-37 threonylcarbamoyl transferase component Bud32